MNYERFVCVLEDSKCCPVCTVFGDLEFCFKSIGVTITSDRYQANFPEELKKLVENGDVRVLQAYCCFSHDYDVKKNASSGGMSCGVAFPLADILKNDCKVDKKFIKAHKKQFDVIDNIQSVNKKLLNQLIKEEEADENDGKK